MYFHVTSMKQLLRATYTHLGGYTNLPVTRQRSS